MRSRTAMHSIRMAALAALTAAGCHGPAHEAPASAAVPAARVVATAAVERKGGEPASVPGLIQARQRAVLAARAPGSVIALPFREGDAVASGAVVARLEDGALRAATTAAEAERAAADADRARVETLLARGAATAREAEQARARAEAAAAAVRSAREALAYAELRAPFAGRLAARPAHVGDVVMPGTPLVEIEGEGGLEVVATVEPELAGRLRPGTRLQAEAEGLPAPVEAVVRAVAPGGDEATYRVQVRADLAPAAGVRSGTFARLRVPAARDDADAEPRLTIPAGSVVRRGGLAGVFVVADGKARLRWIALGAADGAVVEVRAGLVAGERVARDPQGLSDGMAVREG